MTEPEPLQQIDRTFVLCSGKKLTYFSGCDYFRLSSHPDIRRAIATGLNKYGLTVAASRLTTGNHVLYQKLENDLASFFKMQSALVVPTGYTANLAVAQAIAGQFSHALIDDAAHPSLADAAGMLDCPLLKFHHCSAEDLASIVRRCGPGARLILLTDGMFSRDGSVPPLADYLRILPRDAKILLDDAHGAGVLGAHGRGTLEHLGINPRRIILTITLSKAFGGYGGVVLSSKALRDAMLRKSHLVIGSTPLPLPVANAARVAIRLLRADPSLRSRLRHNTQHVKDALRKARITLAETPGPVVALKTRQARATGKIENALRKAGIYPPFIQYPGGPASGYFRFVISSEHTSSQLHNLIEVLREMSSLFQALG